ncbi:MAG: gamma-glutamylcyclotransferase [Burkholderiales bacterium]|nr:gamma-glutamylcyclotransferase [Burkholderiales bacterium]
MIAPGSTLFVYGTLRRGGSNDIAGIAPGAGFVSAARLRGRLIDLGRYPTLVIDPRAGWVTGELYSVPRAAWAALDALEELADATRPDGEYFRVATSVTGALGAALACQVYVANPAALPVGRVIPGGDWLAHLAAARECAPFQQR